MNLDLSTLAAGFIYGVFGLYILRWGKNEGDPPLIVAGLALLIYPYFVENTFLMWGLGAVLVYFAYRRKLG